MHQRAGLLAVKALEFDRVAEAAVENLASALRELDARFHSM